VREVAIATSLGPHPNPDLAKGRGPEEELIERQITIKEVGTRLHTGAIASRECVRWRSLPH